MIIRLAKDSKQFDNNNNNKNQRVLFKITSRLYIIDIINAFQSKIFA